MAIGRFIFSSEKKSPIIHNVIIQFGREMNFHFSKIETRMICFKFGRLLPSGFGEKKMKMREKMRGQTNYM